MCPVEGRVGGGSVPNQVLHSWAVALQGNANELEQKLRAGTVPIIGRIHGEQLLLDVRTIWEEDFSMDVEMVREAMA